MKNEKHHKLIANKQHHIELLFVAKMLIANVFDDDDDDDLFDVICDIDILIDKYVDIQQYQIDVFNDEHNINFNTMINQIKYCIDNVNCDFFVQFMQKINNVFDDNFDDFYDETK